MELEGVRERSNRWLVDVENDPFPICLSPHSLITDGLEVCRQLLDRVAHVCRDLVLSFVYCDQHRCKRKTIKKSRFLMHEFALTEAK